ncbi:hypothetical protein [Bradyrhizobium acaciae]|uniref:hypothetical protein n=1 Tax=Bradyrhizobium acaciae TaxID=2683706 RepID=UPI001E53BBCB|nr:hypothetical protein [Bradyrhizobium acaciae]MCC8978560.1 hypothetical protein [Bradyrhizobium acaciae]
MKRYAPDNFRLGITRANVSIFRLRRRAALRQPSPLPLETHWSWPDTLLIAVAYAWPYDNLEADQLLGRLQAARQRTMAIAQSRGARFGYPCGHALRAYSPDLAGLSDAGLPLEQAIDHETTWRCAAAVGSGLDRRWLTLCSRSLQGEATLD